jgi:hypothetical protein
MAMKNSILTKNPFLKQSPACEANSYETYQNIPSFFRGPEISFPFHYRPYKSLHGIVYTPGPKRGIIQLGDIHQTFLSRERAYLH